MSSRITAWGVAHQIRGISESRDARGRLHGRSYNDLDLEIRSAGRITADHNDACRVGTVIYAEINEHEQLVVVGVVDAKLAELGVPLYWSGEYESRGPRAAMEGRHHIADSAELVGMSVVSNPASHDARALRWHDGDLIEGRGKWPLNWRRDAVLERALEYAYRNAGRPAGAIIDRRDRGTNPYMDEVAKRLRDHPEEFPTQPRGTVEHSMHRGSVITVR